MVPPLSLISNLLIALIKGYQLIISPLLGPHCRFQPTCSQYGVEAVCRFGILKGIWLILKRILKCHPLNSGREYPISSKTFDSREY